MSEIVFFVSSTGVTTLDHMKNSFEITLAGIGVDVSVIAVVNKTISGVFYRSLFSLPTRPYCFSLLFLNVQCGITRTCRRLLNAPVWSWSPWMSRSYTDGVCESIVLICGVFYPDCVGQGSASELTSLKSRRPQRLRLLSCPLGLDRIRPPS